MLSPTVDYDKFYKWVKKEGFDIDESGLNHLGKILKDGETQMTFAVRHSKGSKDYVKPCYVNNFKKLLRNADN